MPPPIAALASEMLKKPVTINVAAAVGAGGRHHAGGLSRAAGAQAALLLELLQRDDPSAGAGVHAHEASRQPPGGVPGAARIKAERIHGNRSQSQRTQALAGFKSGRYPVLVATDIAARGIDVEALSHVVNFDVPAAPDDYIHRVGRTGRAEMTGEAFTFVTPAGRRRLARDRARHRAIAPARHAAGLRLPVARHKTARDSARPAHSRDPRAQSRRAGPREEECGTAGRHARALAPPAEFAAFRAFAACRSAARRPLRAADGSPPPLIAPRDLSSSSYLLGP